MLVSKATLNQYPRFPFSTQPYTNTSPIKQLQVSNQNPLNGLRALLMRPPSPILSPRLLVRSKEQLLYLLGVRSNNSRVNQIVEKVKEGVFFINQVESPFTCQIPRCPQGGEFLHRSEYSQFYQELEHFIDFVNRWIDEYPQLQEKILLRDFASKSHFDETDLEQISAITQNSKSRDAWILKAHVAFSLKNEEMALLALDSLKNIPLLRKNTLEEKELLQSICEKLSKAALISTSTIDTSLLFSRVSKAYQAHLPAPSSLLNDKFLNTLVQSMCENIHFLDQTRQINKLSAFLFLQEKNPTYTKKQICLGHEKKIRRIKSLDQIDQAIAEILYQENLDRTVRQPAHVDTRLVHGKSSWRDLVLQKYHYDHVPNCTKFKVEERVDWVKTLGKADLETFEEVLKDMLNTNIDFNFSTPFITNRYYDNILKILLVLRAFELQSALHC